VAHSIAPEAEKILDKEFPVLNHGFVRLVDYLGNDARIVQAARVSYGDGTKSVSEDAALIDYLLRNEHTSPFEQVILTYHIKLPIFVARQWVRHRTARLNEVSGRYSVMRDEFYLPEPEEVAAQATDNKQGRAAAALPVDEARAIISSLEQGQRAAYQEYKKLIDKNLARELARVNLPLSLYTEWYWQIDLHNLFHFLKLRLDEHAQKEIRLYAEVLLQTAKAVAPLACGSFENHVKGGVSFSKDEMRALKNLLDGKASGPEGKAGERFQAKIR
jgi:thymidylate synthase (FAD)